MSPLLVARTTDAAPADFVCSHGTVVARFDEQTQDSGNRSWLVDTPDGELFVKSAGPPTEPPLTETRLPHRERIRLLRNAAELARSCDHPALATLLNVVETPDGPLLVYRSAPGELLGTDTCSPRRLCFGVPAVRASPGRPDPHRVRCLDRPARRAGRGGLDRRRRRLLDRGVRDESVDRRRCSRWGVLSGFSAPG